MLPSTNLGSLEKDIRTILRTIIDQNKSKPWKGSFSSRILKKFAKRKIATDWIDSKNGINTLNQK